MKKQQEGGDGKIVLCVCVCVYECVYMCVCVPGHRSCKYVSMCKCVCFVCDKRGMEEGVKERARSRDSVGRRRRRRKM